MRINRRLWNAVIAVFVVFALLASASQAIRHVSEAYAAGTLSTKVHIFYYPWYGTNPYRHWDQGGHTPPNDIGSNFYPVPGPYDSGDFAGVVTTHMQQIQQAGVGVIVLSWWGQGSYEDTKVAGIMDIANQYGIKVAFHIEPYGSRTANSVVGDVNYINSHYGSHPAYYRDAEHGNRPAFYVFETYRITDWSPIAPLKSANIILQQTAEDFTQTPNFGGLYTYDGIAGSFAPGWAVASAYAQAHDLIWAPSVGPGYIDDRAVPGNTTPTLDRRDGVAYDDEWRNVLSPANGQPTWISVTSFNEWHEGSQIEPAKNAPPSGYGYLTYQGAYGLTGSAAESAYITRTKYWVDTFDPQGSPRPQAPGMLIANAGDRQISLTWEAASGATSYNVKRSPTSGGSYITISNVTGTSFTDTNLTNGTPYYYAVWAVNGSGESILATNEASAAPFSGTNLIPNPGFENGNGTDAANWTEGTLHTRIGAFKNGGWSLISNFIGAGSAQTLSSAISVSPNTTYTLSGWVYVFKAGRACIDLNGTSGLQPLCTTTDMSQISAWKYLSGTWNSGSNTSVTVRLSTDQNPYTTWFDDIRLSAENSPTPPPDGNLVLNPGFETAGSSAADAANWTEGTNHTRASDKFHEGGWALHSTYRGTGTDTRTTAPIAVLPNTTYTYSGWIWRTNPTGGACMDMNDLAGERQLCTNTAGSWQYLSGTWSSGSNTSVILRLITDGSPTGDIWFDDISLVGGAPVVTNTPTRTPTNTPMTGTPTRTSTPTRTPTPTNTPPGPLNLVLNPGFETAGGSAADAANWTEGTNHTRASDKFHSGGWSLHSTYRGTGTDTRTTAPIAVLPNTTYTYSGYIWRTNSTGGACMDMADIAGESQLCTSTSGSWQFLSGAWNSGSNTNVTLRLITDGSPTGDIWFDDISLASGGPTPTPTNTSTPSSPLPPQNIHLSWTDTGGVVDTSTTMNATWSTTQTGDSIVKYGLSSSYGSQATGTTAQSASLGLYMHSVKLTGLVPNQLYHYSVGSTTLGYSGDFTFRTAPAKGTVGSYSIGLWSDTQNNTGNTNFEVTSGIMTKMIPYAPLFTLHMGDLVENGSNTQSMKDFLAMSQGLNAIAPLMPVLGNHDLNNTTQAPYGNFTDGFNLPGNELYYSFDYGNAHFTAVNTGVANVASESQALFRPGTAQYDWLVNDLSAANSDPAIKWKIVYMHFPPYATGVSMVPYVQSILAPLMDTYHVDLVISGHRHVYERTKSLNNNTVVQPGPDYTVPPYASVYVVNGSAGGDPQGDGSSWFTAKTWADYDFAILNINGNVLTYTLKSSTDNDIDSFTITK